VKSGMKPSGVQVPPYLPDTETVRKDICDYYWKAQRFDRETGELLATLDKMGELEHTLVVISGDNGWPFPRSKATIYEAGTHVPLAVCWPGRVAGGRVIEDFVSLSDVAPTFLEAAGLAPRPAMTARSLMNVLLSNRSGRVDPKRDHVLTGMERHVPCRGEIRGGYPMRALRNHQFHYIRNFKADRWPAGDPDACAAPDSPGCGYDLLAKNTRVGFADVDAGPSKAHMVLHRNEAKVQPLFELAFGKRPERELYDLKKDPWQMRNVAADPAYAGVLRRLDAQLTAELKQTADPRIEGRGDIFDQYQGQLMS